MVRNISLKKDPVIPGKGDQRLVQLRKRKSKSAVAAASREGRAVDPHVFQDFLLHGRRVCREDLTAAAISYQRRGGKWIGFFIPEICCPGTAGRGSEDHAISG